MPTIDFKLLFVFMVLAHERRRVLHFNVTEHPTAEWTAMQLGQALPWDTAPRYLLRDRDRTMATPSGFRQPACRSPKFLRPRKLPGNRRTSNA